MTVIPPDWPSVERKGDTFVCGDVLDLKNGWGWVVVVSEEDKVTSSTPDTIFTVYAPGPRGGRWREFQVAARECCEPGFVVLGKTGRMTHYFSYAIIPRNSLYTVRAFLDVDLRSAVPEPHPEARKVEA